MPLTKPPAPILLATFCYWLLICPLASAQESKPAEGDKTEQQSDKVQAALDSDEATSEANKAAKSEEKESEEKESDKDSATAEKDRADQEEFAEDKPDEESSDGGQAEKKEGSDEPTTDKDDSDEERGKGKHENEKDSEAADDAVTKDNDDGGGDNDSEGYRGERILNRGASEWKYFDGRDEPQDWAQEDFDDSQWNSGTAPLGYGEKDLATKLSYGDDEDKKHPTAWFRRYLEIDDPTKYELIEAHVRADDGAIFYVNGKPANQLSVLPPNRRQDKYAGINTAREGSFDRVLISSRHLHEGKNILAVSVHQCKSDSSDVVLDMDMWGLSRDEALRSRQADLFDEASPTEIYYKDVSFPRYAGFFGSQWASTDEVPTIKTLLRSFRNNRATKIELIGEKTKPQTSAEVYRNARSSVLAFFHVSKQDSRVVSMGSGVIISENGAAITNYHVVANPRRPGSNERTNVSKEVLVAGTMDGKFYPVTRILAGSIGDDAAVVQLGGEDFEAASLVANKAVGTPVNVISCPHFQMFQLTTGTITRYSQAGSRKWMSISAEIGGGSSGGPVFDDCGNVVGITVAVRPLTRNGISLARDEDTGFLKIAENATSNLQLNRMHEMTINLCVPARSVLKLISD